MATRAERIVELAGKKRLSDPKPIIETPEEKSSKRELMERQRIERNRAKFEGTGLVELLEELMELLPFSKFVFLYDGMVIRFTFACDRISASERVYKVVDFAIVDQENAHLFYDEKGTYGVDERRLGWKNIIARYTGIFFSKLVAGLYVNKSIVGVDGDIVELVSEAMARPIEISEVDREIGSWS